MLESVAEPAGQRPEAPSADHVTPPQLIQERWIPLQHADLHTAEPERGVHRAVTQGEFPRDSRMEAEFDAANCEQVGRAWVLLVTDTTPPTEGLVCDEPIREARRTLDCDRRA